MSAATKKAVTLDHLQALAGRTGDCLADVAETAVEAIGEVVETIPGAMTGATSQAAGAGGTAPGPAAGDETKFLRGDGAWARPNMVGSAFNVSTSDPSSSDTDIIWIKAQSLS